MQVQKNWFLQRMDGLEAEQKFVVILECLAKNGEDHAANLWLSHTVKVFSFSRKYKWFQCLQNILWKPKKLEHFYK